MKKYLNPKISYKSVITLNNDQIIKIKNLYKDSKKKLTKNLNIDLENWIIFNNFFIEFVLTSYFQF